MKTIVPLLLLAASLACGCRTPTPRAESPSPAASNHQVLNTRNNAYSLLYDLVSQQKDVSKLLIIKRDSRELNALIKEIAHTSGTAKDTLEAWHQKDAALPLDALQLPPGEVATRDAITATKTKELLGSSGDTFERALLLTQIQALGYATHLALVASRNEASPDRVAWLQNLSTEMAGLQSRCIALLARTPHGA